MRRRSRRRVEWVGSGGLGAFCLLLCFDTLGWFWARFGAPRMGE